MIFRFVHRQAGAHVVVLVYAAPSFEGFEGTFAHIGQLSMSEAEWAAFRALLLHGSGGDQRDDSTIDVAFSAP